jgi:hypothetical protein
MTVARQWESVILTVIDRFSKAAHFLPLGHPYTATSVASTGSLLRLLAIGTLCSQATSRVNCSRWRV